MSSLISPQSPSAYYDVTHAMFLLRIIIPSLTHFDLFLDPIFSP
ncbi:MAG TPA: hypothetical protein VGO47_06235 [Chlamydiales bacterium]|nr:hypothetical protein [Chlamydiales bacterium]